MPALGIRNKDGATKTIGINGTPPLMELTEAGLKMLKPLKALPSAAPDDVVVQSQVILGELLAEGAANNSAAVVLSWDDTDFDHYIVEWSAVTPTANSAVLLMDISADGGVSYKASPSYFAGTASNNDGEVDMTGNYVFPGYRIGGSGSVGIAAGSQGTSGQLVSGDKTFNMATSRCVFDSGKIWSVSAAHFGATGSTINALRFAMNVGLILSGKFRIYGVR